MMHVHALTKSYGHKHILNNVSLHVTADEVFGIIGPNGSGKSTLLKQLSRVERANSGKIVFKDKDIHSYTQKEIAQQIAVLQQDPLTAAGFTVREVVKMGRFPFQTWLGEDEAIAHVEQFIDETLQTMNIKYLSEQTIDHLSGGEKQRVALAKTIVQSPSLLMLDEPTTYLDIGYQKQLMDQITEWKEKQEMTVIAVLHDLNVAALYCDRILLLDAGEVIAIGTPEEVLTKERLTRVYGIEPMIITHPKKSVPQILL
ncbi:MAG TPA: ABC transporter ATP-binding protein [Bacillota bacterium]|nr:ABC transporter ATP-binding protein [Bacillota bacterium]